MSAGLLLIIGLVLLFVFLGITTVFKKNKNVVKPTVVDEVTPVPSMVEVVVEPTPVPQDEPVAPPVPINETCYEFEVIVSDSEETICSKLDSVKVYSSNPNAISEPSHLFMSENACKFHRINWDDTHKFVRLGNKYSSVDSNGYASDSKDC